MNENILYLSLGFPQVRINKFLTSLKKNNNVELLICNYNEEKRGTWEEAVIPTSIEEKNKYLTKFPYNPRVKKRIDLTLQRKKFKPTVVITRDIFLANHGYKIAKKYNAKFIIDIADNYPEVFLQRNPFNTGAVMNNILNFFEKNILKKADYILTVTEESKKLLMKKHNIIEKKILAIRNVPLIDEVEEPIREERIYDFVYIGTYSQGIRDLKTVLNTVELHPDLSFHIYTFQKQEVTTFINKHIDIENYNIVINNAVKKDQLNSVLSKYKIGLIPHFRGPGTDYTEPNKLYDYIHADLPILASNNPAMATTIESLKVGRCYSPGDSSAFKKAYDEIILDYPLYMRNLQESKKGLFWEDEVKKLMKVL